jgi:hypothetical protein
MRGKRLLPVIMYLLVFSLAGSTFGQQPAQPPAAQPLISNRAAPGPDAAFGRLLGNHPPLFFGEKWKQAEKEEHPIRQENVSNPNLELKLYGSANGGMQLTGHGQAEDPTRIFMGTCLTPCAAGLRDKNNYVDLTGLAKIRWGTRTSGFHKLRPLLKLADGTYLVGNHADGEISDYHETEFSISDVLWIKLDIDNVVAKGDFLAKPDLSKVDEVGFADLMPGSGHGQGGFSVLTTFEVYGKPVPRKSIN